MGLVQGGSVITEGTSVAIRGAAVAGIAAQGQVIWRPYVETAVAQINCGNAAVTNWTTTNFGYSVYNMGSHDTTGVPNAAPAAVYNEAISSTTTFLQISLTGYNVSNSYFLRLHFGENSTMQPGQRLMTLALNGDTFRTGLDVAAIAPYPSVLVVDSPITSPAQDGSFLLYIGPGSGSMISGIEVIELTIPS